MAADNNETDPTLTYEKEERQKVTLSNRKPTEAENEERKTKATLSSEHEKEILEEIQKHCDKWDQIANLYVFLITFFGISAVTTSVIVSIYTGEETLISVQSIKILAGISTISLAILTAFNLVNNGNSARSAWRSLNAALMLYKAGSLSIQQLIEQYQKGESQVGNLNFNYGPNAAIYKSDIRDSEEEKKQNLMVGDTLINQALAKQKAAESNQEASSASKEDDTIDQENQTLQEAKKDLNNIKNEQVNKDFK